MIAYKVFESERGKLFPIVVYDFIDYYPRQYIHTRADGCGPFACFETLLDAKRFLRGFLFPSANPKIFKVRIKQSNDRLLWINGHNPLFSVPQGTIFADEFEILEEVK